MQQAEQRALFELHTTSLNGVRLVPIEDSVIVSEGKLPGDRLSPQTRDGPFGNVAVALKFPLSLDALIGYKDSIHECPALLLRLRGVSVSATALVQNLLYVTSLPTPKAKQSRVPLRSCCCDDTAPRLWYPYSNRSRQWPADQRLAECGTRQACQPGSPKAHHLLILVLF